MFLLLLIIIYIFAFRCKTRGLKQEDKIKVFRVARGPDLRQDKMTQE